MPDIKPEIFATSNELKEHLLSTRPQQQQQQQQVAPLTCLVGLSSRCVRGGRNSARITTLQDPGTLQAPLQEQEVRLYARTLTNTQTYITTHIIIVVLVVEKKSKLRIIIIEVNCIHTLGFSSTGRPRLADEHKNTSRMTHGATCR